MKRIAILSLLALAVSAATAKLPAPVLSDEAKAKAAEAAAKTAHGNKVADFQLCRSMERVALKFQADAKKAGKDAKPPTATPPCADPGAFVYPPPAVATAAAPAPAATPAPAAAAKPPAKKG
jgi:hypothetical protein